MRRLLFSDEFVMSEHIIPQNPLKDTVPGPFWYALTRICHRSYARSFRALFRVNFECDFFRSFEERVPSSIFARACLTNACAAQKRIGDRHYIHASRLYKKEWRYEQKHEGCF